MKKIIIKDINKNEIDLSLVDITKTPIFAKKNGKLSGMLVNESHDVKNNGAVGWILRIGGVYGAYGYDSSIKESIKKGESFGYTFL